jgi:prepilin-type N-terminal cleavage/methylation domain-containing protein
MSRTHGMRGLTLVELLVAVVVASVVMASVFAILVSNQRIYAVQSEKIIGQQTIRAGAEIMATELREMSIAGGDLIAMDDDEVTFRAGRAFAVACDVAEASGVLTVRAWPGAGTFAGADSVFIFSDGDPELSSDDVWLMGTVNSVDNTPSGSTCGVVARPEIELVFNNLAPAAAVPGVRVGAPIRGFEVIRYGVATLGGQPYLGRGSATGALEAIVGPLAPGGDGLELVYLDGDGNMTATPAQVRSIVLTLRSASDIQDQAGRPVADSLTVVVNTRN